MNKKLIFFSLIAISLFFAVQANALFISGPDILTTAPDNVGNNDAINDHQQGFNEVQNYTLLSALGIDGGSISKGTRVSSHMIFSIQREPRLQVISKHGHLTV